MSSVERSENCPDSNDLIGVLFWPDSVEPSLKEHVNACAWCQQKLDELSNSKRLDEYRPIAHNLKPGHIPTDAKNNDDNSS